MKFLLSGDGQQQEIKRNTKKLHLERWSFFFYPDKQLMTANDLDNSRLILNGGKEVMNGIGTKIACHVSFFRPIFPMTEFFVVKEGSFRIQSASHGRQFFPSGL